MHHPEITALRNAGYKVIERSPWHYQVAQRATMLNIWPTKRKWMMQHDSGASFYKDTGDLLRIVKTGRVLVMPPITEAEKEWQHGRQKLSTLLLANAM